MTSTLKLMMKSSTTRVALILVLSLILWVVLYMTSSPPTPLSSSETVGLVGIVALLVIVGGWVTNRVRKGKQDHD